MKKIEIGFCCKCSDAITQRTSDDHDIECLELTGCKKLTKQEWDDGLPTNIHEYFNQKNCPLIRRNA